MSLFGSTLVEFHHEAGSNQKAKKRIDKNKADWRTNEYHAVRMSSGCIKMEFIFDFENLICPARVVSSNQ